MEKRRSRFVWGCDYFTAETVCEQGSSLRDRLVHSGARLPAGGKVWVKTPGKLWPKTGGQLLPKTPGKLSAET